MTDPNRDALIEEMVELLKYIRDIEDNCKFNRSCPLPSDGLDKLPHVEILLGHTYITQTVHPAAQKMTTQWLLITPLARQGIRTDVFRDTLKNFKRHYDEYLLAIRSVPPPMLFNKAEATKAIRTVVRKQRSVETKRAPKEKKPPQPKLMDGFPEACAVSRFRRNLENSHGRTKHRRGSSGAEGQTGDGNLPPVD